MKVSVRLPYELHEKMYRHKKSSSDLPTGRQVNQKSLYFQFEIRSCYSDLSAFDIAVKVGVGTLFRPKSEQVVKASSGHIPLPFLISENVKERAQI